MGHRFVATVVLLALVPWPASAQDAAPLKVEHTPAVCFRPGENPQIRARITPITSVVKAEVLFRSDKTAEPHVVPMKQEGPEFVALLPKPTGNPLEVFYRVQATDPNLAAVSTPEAAMIVTTCSNAAVTVVTKERIEVRAPAGAPPVPPGFGEEKVVAEGTPGESHVGVFRLGPALSLGAALAVGGVAYAGGLKRANGTIVPDTTSDPTSAGVTLLEATPNSGSVTTLAALRVTVRILSRVDTFGSPRLELIQGIGSPVCALSQVSGSFNLSGNEARIVEFPPPHSTGACGASYEAGVLLVRYTDFAGVDSAPTAVPATQLPLHYTIVP